MNQDTFERPTQVTEYIAAINSRFLPLKFAYIGPAAHTHDELVRSHEYGIADTEANLIRSKLVSIVPDELKRNGVNIIDIGSGNGLKATHIIRTFLNERTTIRYFALDYSSELSSIALRNIESVMPSIALESFIVDFETTLFRDVITNINRNNNFRNFFLLLGHTLGNPAKRDVALRNIVQSMNYESYLLTGVELYDSTKISNILEHYKNEPFYRAVFNPLTFCGIQKEDGILDIQFNRRTQNVEVYFEFTRNFSSEIPPFESTSFKKEERLLIFLSHRFDRNELENLFTQSGLKIKKTVQSEDQSYLLILSNRDRSNENLS